MIDHIGVVVSNYARSVEFYRRALAPLGHRVLHEVSAEESGNGPFCGFGVPPRPDFWISPGFPNRPSLHVAFTAADRASVDAFYAAAIAAGGRDNGPPGLRPHYHPDYYGAFVHDPDGHNIEAVCHAPG